MLAGKGKSSSPGAIYASIPYIKAEVPIFILFRALGFIVSSGFLSKCNREPGASTGEARTDDTHRVSLLLLITAMGSLTVAVCKEVRRCLFCFQDQSSSVDAFLFIFIYFVVYFDFMPGLVCAKLLCSCPCHALLPPHNDLAATYSWSLSSFDHAIRAHRLPLHTSCTPALLCLHSHLACR